MVLMGKLTLYNNEFCPECRAVREKMGILQLSYYCINVNPVKPERQNVIELTGQYSVPVLVDDGQVFVLKDAVLAHLAEKYGEAAGAPSTCGCQCT